MSVWRQVLVLCVLCVPLVQGVPTAVLHSKYLTSYRLTRSTRCHVQQLLLKYKQEQMGSRDYEDRSQHLKGLPSLSTDFYIWMNLSDSERLGSALSDMQTFRNMLQWKREELNTTGTNSTVPQNFHHIECDLRDLLAQVNTQMSSIGGSWTRPVSPGGHRTDWDRDGLTQWDSLVEGYIILRDLDLYLVKLARDFLLLASKTKAPAGTRSQTSSM